MKRWIMLASMLMPSVACAQVTRTIGFSENLNAATVAGGWAEVTLAPSKSGIEALAAIRAPDGCLVAVTEAACPEGKEIKFFNFEAALNWSHESAGYLG